MVPASFGQNSSAARLEQIKARRAELEKGFIAELHRLNRLLSAQDQVWQLQAASGSIKREDAAAMLKQKTIAVFEKGFSETEYQTTLRELLAAAERFFSVADQKIEFAVRWPADKPEAEYQRLARSELAAARAAFDRVRDRPAESLRALERVNQVMAWSQGHREVPPEMRFFSGQSERVVQALAEARVKTFLELSQPRLPTPTNEPPLVTGHGGIVHPGITAVAPTTNAAVSLAPVTVGEHISPQAVERYARGIQLGNEGRWPQAEAEYRAAIQIDGREGLFHLALANALMSQSKVQEAEPVYRAAIQLRPTVKESFQGWGAALYQLQRYEEAAQAYQQLVRLSPQTAEFHGFLAYPLLMSRRWTEAEAALHEAIRLSPQRADYFNGLGNIYYQTQKFSDATKAYRQAVTLTPTSAASHLYLALSLEAGQQAVEARESFRRAYALDSNNPQIALEYANSLARAGQWVEAAPVYTTAVRLNPQEPNAFRGLGHARMGISQFAEAEKAYRDGLRLNGQLGILHADLAGALFRQNRLEEARAAAQQAAQLGFRTHWVFDALGGF